MAKPRNSMRRYHYNIHFPANTADMLLDFFDQIHEVNTTYHAAHQMFDDPRGIIDYPDKSDLMHNDNILVEFYENLDDNGHLTGTIQKILLRVKHLSEKVDYTYLLAREGFIISAWANDKTDIHRLTSKAMLDYYKPIYQVKS